MPLNQTDSGGARNPTAAPGSSAKDTIEKNITHTRFRRGPPAPAPAPVIQDPADTDKSRLAGEKKKKHAKSNASSSTAPTQGFRTTASATSRSRDPRTTRTKANNNNNNNTSCPRERAAAQQQRGPAASSPKSSAGPPLGSNTTTVHGRKPAAAANRTATGQLTPEMSKDLEEAEDEIRKLNELGLGDDISYEEYRDYAEQLPDMPDVDDRTRLRPAQLSELYARHALYRIRYCQLSQGVPEEELTYDKLKEKYPLRNLQKNNFFKQYENNGRLDWSFHHDYCKLAGLEDYQRLVLHNGGFEYARWDEYHKGFHSYEIEQEYVKYYQELSKKLKWIEAYVQDRPSSLQWGRIMTRGNYQAIKIATDFSKITGGLACSGFFDFLGSISFDVNYYNEFDGVYYEIWQRYTKEKKFRDALDEVYKLNRFPLRQNRMRCALDNDTFCSNFEEEFTEDKARQLIAEALRKETRKPKFYEDYCRKKIDIAQAIGLISSVSS